MPVNEVSTVLFNKVRTHLGLLRICYMSGVCMFLLKLGFINGVTCFQKHLHD